MALSFREVMLLAAVAMLTIVFVQAEESGESPEKKNHTCTFSGSVTEIFKTVANITDMDKLILNVELSIPAEAPFPTVLFYTKEQIDTLNTSWSCDQRSAVITNETFKFKTGKDVAGCTYKNTTLPATYACTVTKDFSADTTSAKYIALATCEDNASPNITYTIRATGEGGDDSCEGSDVSGATSVSSHNVLMGALWSIMMLVFSRL